MAIRTGKTFKVYEQATDGEGCGEIMASFSCRQLGEDEARAAAESEAVRCARENPGTRYYVLASTVGVYAGTDGRIGRRDY